MIIVPDCCYSGRWVTDCAKTLDGLGIPPCGHRARESGILIKVYASCQADQKATELCYSVEGVELDNDGILIFYLNKKLINDEQVSCGTDFTKLVCLKGSDESCLSAEALKNWTWQDAVGGGLKSRVQIVRCKVSGRQTWYMVLLSNKSEEYEEKFLEKCKSGNIDVANWGYIIESGWGEGPPQNIKDKVSGWMSV